MVNVDFIYFVECLLNKVYRNPLVFCLICPKIKNSWLGALIIRCKSAVCVIISMMLSFNDKVSLSLLFFSWICFYISKKNSNLAPIK